MEISINADREVGCTVRLGSCAVPFRCETTAGQFVERLRQRLAAARAVQMPPVTDPRHRLTSGLASALQRVVMPLEFLESLL